MNTDIGGLGVRISFYMQTIFLGGCYSPLLHLTLNPRHVLQLAALSARSEKLEENMGALSTLIATNMAMAVTALILGLRPEPEMSFQE